VDSFFLILVSFLAFLEFVSSQGCYFKYEKNRNMRLENNSNKRRTYKKRTL